MDAILAGERNPLKLSALRDPRIKADVETIRKSLLGNWRKEHVFTLKQSRHMYDRYKNQIEECDREIEALLRQFDSRVDPNEKPMPPDQKRPQSKERKNASKDSATGFEFRTEAYKLFGVDLTQVPGLRTIILPLFGEVGRDMSRWTSARQFVSWLSLCPDNDISGGRVLWTGTRKAKNRAAQLFRLAAHSLHRSQTPLGDFLRRMKSKLGPAAATTATARKIAILFYTLVKSQTEYRATLSAKLEVERQANIENKLRRQAKRLGFQLVPLETSPS